MNEQLKSIAGALTNLIVNALLLFNMYRQVTGQPALEIGADNISLTINAVLLALSQLFMWWKNNNISEASIVGQKITNAIKRGDTIEFEEIDE